MASSAFSRVAIVEGVRGSAPQPSRRPAMSEVGTLRERLEQGTALARQREHSRAR
jgi:hypothetical protein